MSYCRHFLNCCVIVQERYWQFACFIKSLFFYIWLLQQRAENLSNITFRFSLACAHLTYVQLNNIAKLHLVLLFKWYFVTVCMFAHSTSKTTMSVTKFSFNIDSNACFVQRENGNILWFPNYSIHSSHIRFFFQAVKRTLLLSLFLVSTRDIFKPKKYHIPSFQLKK